MRLLGSSACLAPIAAVVLLALLAGCSSTEHPVHPIFEEEWATNLDRPGVIPARVVTEQFVLEGEREEYELLYKEILEDFSDRLYGYYSARLKSVESNKNLFYKILRDDGFECAAYDMYVPAAYDKYVVCKAIYPDWGVGKLFKPDETIDNANAHEFVLQFEIAHPRVSNLVSNLKAHVFHLGIRGASFSP